MIIFHELNAYIYVPFIDFQAVQSVKVHYQKHRLFDRFLGNNGDAGQVYDMLVEKSIPQAPTFV
jgi:hypothetical protein